MVSVTVALAANVPNVQVIGLLRDGWLLVQVPASAGVKLKLFSCRPPFATDLSTIPSVSVTRTLLAADGPPLWTTTLYVTGLFWNTCPAGPLLTTCTFASG